MSANRIERMSREADQYLAKFSPGSVEQMQAAKILGLLLWFMCQFAENAGHDEDPRRCISRLWESIMVHADRYVFAPDATAINLVLISMSDYKAPVD